MIKVKKEFIDTINNEDLSLYELSEITKESLSKIYSKLRTEIGMHSPTGIIISLGEEPYDVDVRFIDSGCYSEGDDYETVYHL